MLVFQPGVDSGCTAVVAVKRGNQLFVANAGDSRCVVSCEGKAVEMSFDHKPEDELERDRIETAGGWVTPDGRVKGGLNLIWTSDRPFMKIRRAKNRTCASRKKITIRNCSCVPSRELVINICNHYYLLDHPSVLSQLDPL